MSEGRKRIDQVVAQAMDGVSIDKACDGIIRYLEQEDFKGDELEHMSLYIGRRVQDRINYSIFRNVTQVNFDLLCQLRERWECAKALAENPFWETEGKGFIVTCFQDDLIGDTPTGLMSCAMLARFGVLGAQDIEALWKIVDEDKRMKIRQGALIVLAGAAQSVAMQRQVWERARKLDEVRQDSWTLQLIIRVWEGGDHYPTLLEEGMVDVVWSVLQDDIMADAIAETLNSAWKWFSRQCEREGWSDERLGAVIQKLKEKDLFQWLRAAADEHLVGSPVRAWERLGVVRLLNEGSRWLGDLEATMLLSCEGTDWIRQVFGDFDTSLQARFLALAPQRLRATVLGKLGKSVEWANALKVGR